MSDEDNICWYQRICGSYIKSYNISNGLGYFFGYFEPAKPAGRKNQLIDSPVSKLAKELNLNLTTPISIEDISSEIKNINPDVMIVISYGQLLPLEVLEIPKFKTINIHPSLLPRLRGPSPIQNALAQGLTETGVSLMVIDEKMDHGPVISQEVFLIDQSENYLTLEFQLAQIGASMLIRDLPKYVSGEIKPQEQNHTEATFTKLIKKKMAWLITKKCRLKKFIIYGELT